MELFDEAVLASIVGAPGASEQRVLSTQDWIVNAFVTQSTEAKFQAEKRQGQLSTQIAELESRLVELRREQADLPAGLAEFKRISSNAMSELLQKGAKHNWESPEIVGKLAVAVAGVVRVLLEQDDGETRSKAAYTLLRWMRDRHQLYPIWGDARGTSLSFSRRGCPSCMSVQQACSIVDHHRRECRGRGPWLADISTEEAFTKQLLLLRTCPAVNFVDQIAAFRPRKKMRTSDQPEDIDDYDSSASDSDGS